MKHYTIDEKIALVKDIDDMISSGTSRKRACREMHTDDRTYERFKAEISNISISHSNQSDIDTISDGIQSDIDKTSINDDKDIANNLHLDIRTPTNRVREKKEKKVRFLISLPASKLQRLKDRATDQGMPYATLAAQYVLIKLNES